MPETTPDSTTVSRPRPSTLPCACCSGPVEDLSSHCRACREITCAGCGRSHVELVAFAAPEEPYCAACAHELVALVVGPELASTGLHADAARLVARGYAVDASGLDVGGAS